MEYDVKKGMTPEKLAEMDAERIDKLQDAGIDEGEVLEDAKKNNNLWDNYFSENNTRGKDDLNFCMRDQWTAIERSEFTRLFKPAMTFNKIYDPVKKLVGEQRKNKPDLQVRSLTGKATQEQIDLRSDLVRTISYQSQNDLIYQAAFKSALLRGYGAFQVGIDYEAPRSFKQTINYQLIPDVTRTTFDPSAIKPHRGDGNFCSRRYLFSQDEFDATFPYILRPVSYEDPRTLLDFQWETRNTVVVCDYYKKEWYPLNILDLSNGMTVTEDEWEDMQKRFGRVKELAEEALVVKGIILNEIPKVRAERQTQDYQIMHYRLIKDKIIEFSEWPSKFLPLIFVDGDSYYVDGNLHTRSFIHEARDAQKFINYVGSETAAEIKNRRREQWLGTPDNIIGQEQQWRNPELQQGILIAKPDQKTGMMPSKMPAWDISQGLLAQYQRGTMDIREILGIMEANLGMQGNEVSAKAIRERKMSGGMSDYVFRDNLNQAIEQAGRVVLDLLPTVYGGKERAIVITKADGKTKNLILNQEMPDGTIKNELVAGDFDIEISAGPSFAVQKEAAMEMMLELVSLDPQKMLPLVADYIAKNMDVEFMAQISERFKTLVPPEILAKEEGQPPPSPPPPSPEEQMMHQQMEQAQQQMQLNEQKMHIEEQQLQERAEELSLRKEKHQLEQLEMLLKAKQAQAKMGLDEQKNQIEVAKMGAQFQSTLASLLADIHQSAEQRHHEKHINATKLVTDLVHPKHNKEPKPKGE